MKPFCWAARVYWEDTDGGGVVYYANYLKYLERARTEWLRAAGFSQQALATGQGIVFTVTHVEVDYRRPARLDDELIITCEPRRIGAASLSFAQRVHRRTEGLAMTGGPADTGERAVTAGALPPGAGELLAEAAVEIACVDARTFRPQRLPQFLTDVLNDEERA